MAAADMSAAVLFDGGLQVDRRLQILHWRSKAAARMIRQMIIVPEHDNQWSDCFSVP